MVWGDQQMRNLGIVALCIALAGCGLAARAERQKQMAAAVAAAQQGYADCKTQFPEDANLHADRETAVQAQHRYILDQALDEDRAGLRHRFVGDFNNGS